MEETAVKPTVDFLQACGVNHRSADLAIREKFAFPKGGAEDILVKLRERLGLEEIVGISTCNRTEFFFASPKPISAARVFHEAFHFPETPDGAPEGLFYEHRGIAAARHLFRVAAGLDSMVLGENQILNQVKRAYNRSLERKWTGVATNTLFQKAFEAAKRVRSSTTLATCRASVPAAALDVARAVFEDLSAARVTVIGTGDVGREMLAALRKTGVKKITGVSRTAERAAAWGYEQDVEARAMDDLPAVLSRTDVVIACAAQSGVVTKDMLARAIAAKPSDGRPLLVFDLGLPRNAEPSVRDIEQVYLCDLDDLQRIIEKDRRHVDKETADAERLVEGILEEYRKECLAMSVSGDIREIRVWVERMADEELSGAMKRLEHLSPADREVVERMVERITGKFLHPPTKMLSAASGNGEGKEAAAWIRRIFGVPFRGK